MDRKFTDQNEKEELSEYLFVYGTLLSDASSEIKNIFSKYTIKVSDGSYQGKMYLVEHPDNSLVYPAAIPSEKESDRISGEIVKVLHPKKIFQILDDYEECTPDYPEPHEYKRIIVDIRGADGDTIRAQMYIYNLSIETLKRIKDPSFMEFMKKYLGQS